MVRNLTVRTDQVQKNLQWAGKTSFSGHYLLELVKTGVTREQAYAWVQECAIGALEGQGDFVERVAAHPEIKKKLSPEKIRQLGSNPYQLRHVKDIYARALKEKRVSS